MPCPSHPPWLAATSNRFSYRFAERHQTADLYIGNEFVYK
jgi:hypothetical protein